MAIGTDYGLAVFNERGVDVLGGSLFMPKLIGTLTLRQKEPGRLYAVAADGTELSETDGSRNLPLTALRADGIGKAYDRRGSKPARFGGEVSTTLTRKYEFSLHGCGATAPLLAAVIHGWGERYDADKFAVAENLVQSVLSGEDWQLAASLQQGGDAAAQMAASESRYNGIRTGLPCTLTFRCRALSNGTLDGFGLAAATAGRLYVEMTANTEMVLHFYDCAGVPWDYFARCSTVESREDYGLAVYDYEPPLTKLVWTSPTEESYGKPVTASPLHMSSIPRARYFFTNSDNTLGGIARSIGNENAVAQRQLCKQLEDSADAPLRYELYNNARPLLRLLSNSGSLKKGRQVSVRDVGSMGKLYTVQAGHDYTKVCTLLHHACGGLFDLSGGGVLNGIGNVHAHSVFERSFANIPRQARPTGIADDYNGAPWNPTVAFKLSAVFGQAGLDYYKPSPKQSFDALMGEPTVLDKFNRFIHDKTWQLQRALNVVFKLDPTIAYLPNPNYDPEEAAKRLEAMHDYQAQLDAEQAERELNGGGYDMDIYRQIERELGGRQAMLEMIANILDGSERYLADLVPFWGLPAYRHSGDRLELYQHLSVKSSGNATPPDYLPENWILCRTPD